MKKTLYEIRLSDYICNVFAFKLNYYVYGIFFPGDTFELQFRPGCTSCGG